MAKDSTAELRIDLINATETAFDAARPSRAERLKAALRKKELANAFFRDVSPVVSRVCVLGSRSCDPILLVGWAGGVPWCCSAVQQSDRHSVVGA